MKFCKRVGALLGRADDRDAGARPHLGDAGEQVLLDHVAGRRQLAHAAVGFGGGEALLHERLLRVARMGDELVREIPCFLLGLAADDLQAHAEADVVLAAVRRGHGADLGHVGADALVGVAPEQVNVGMLGRDLPGLPAAAAEIESRMRLLQRMRPDLRLVELVELAVMGDGVLRPQLLEERHLLFHDFVALFLAPLDAFGGVLRLALARDQVDADAPARELVEGRDHLRQQHGIDVARPRRHQHADRLRARDHHRRGDPRLPARGLHRHQHVFEARRLGRRHDLVEQLERRRDLGVGEPIGRGVAGGRQEPSEFEALVGRHGRPPPIPSRRRRPSPAGPTSRSPI